MLMFLHGAHVAQILAGEKTETRRTFRTYYNTSCVYTFVACDGWETDLTFLSKRADVPGVLLNVPLREIRIDGKTLYRVGQTRAVMPGRGKKAVGRVRITGLSLEDVGSIREAGAQAEGGYTPAEYEALWRRIHTHRGTYTDGHTRIVVRFELVKAQGA